MTTLFRVNFTVTECLSRTSPRADELFVTPRRDDEKPESHPTYAIVAIDHPATCFVDEVADRFATFLTTFIDRRHEVGGHIFEYDTPLNDLKTYSEWRLSSGIASWDVDMEVPISVVPLPDRKMRLDAVVTSTASKAARATVFEFIMTSACDSWEWEPETRKYYEPAVGVIDPKPTPKTLPAVAP